MEIPILVVKSASAKRKRVNGLPGAIVVEDALAPHHDPVLSACVSNTGAKVRSTWRFSEYCVLRCVIRKGCAPFDPFSVKPLMSPQSPFDAWMDVLTDSEPREISGKAATRYRQRSPLSDGRQATQKFADRNAHVSDC